MMKNIVLLICLMCATALIQAQEETVVEVPKIGVKVDLGDSVTIDGFTILFSEVVEDSRCPTGVTCVWAGRAKIKIEVSDTLNIVDHQILTFGEDAKNIILQTEAIRIVGMTLIPHPAADDGGIRDYALIVVRETLKN